MSEALSLAARSRLATIFKQLKAKFPKSDSRLAAAAYAVYVCQSARQAGENFPRLMSAAQVVLPDYLKGTSVLDYFLSEESDAATDQQPIAYRASRLIEDLAKLNASSLDLVTKEKLTAKWAELPARELPFQLLLLLPLRPCAAVPAPLLIRRGVRSRARSAPVCSLCLGLHRPAIPLTVLSNLLLWAVVIYLKSRWDKGAPQARDPSQLRRLGAARALDLTAM